MILEDDFGAQGTGPYKAISKSKLWKMLAALASHTPQIIVRTWAVHGALWEQ